MSQHLRNGIHRQTSTRPGLHVVFSVFGDRMRERPLLAANAVLVAQYHRKQTEVLLK